MSLLDDLDKKELIQIIEKLEKENKELKEKIYGKIEVKDLPKESKDISNEEKIKIFMEVFKGRTDLYAKRWTSKKQVNQAIHQFVRMNLVCINVISQG